MLSGRGFCGRADHSSRGVVPRVVCLCVVSKTSKMRLLGSSRAVAPDKKETKLLLRNKAITPTHVIRNMKAYILSSNVGLKVTYTA